MHGIEGLGGQTGAITFNNYNITRGINSLIFKTTKLFRKTNLRSYF